METISSVIYHDLKIDKYLGSNNSCFIDIETTGLSRSKNMIYLIGLLYPLPNSDTWILKQYFANSMGKEKELLKEFIHDLSSFDKIITYNGDSFDLPFINHRLEFYSLKPLNYKSKSFDLYRLIKQNKEYFNLPNLKLKTIEESLGFFREDIYSGFDCIGFYYDYISSNRQELKDNILKHNYDDLVHMLDIIPILDVLDKKKSLLINFKDSVRKLTIDSIDFIGDMINIDGSIDIPLEKDIQYYDLNYKITTENLNKFKISTEFKEGYITEEDRCIYIDTLDFQSLNLSDNTNYNLPNNIFVLIIEKNYCIDNLKSLLLAIFENSII